MKILEVVKLFYPPELGGVEVFTAEICRELSKNHQITALCAAHEPESRVDHYNHYAVYRAASICRVFSTAIAPGAGALLRTFAGQSDVIHFHMPNPVFNLAMFPHFPDVPVVVHWHSDIVRQWYLMPLYRPLQDWLLRRASTIVATSPAYMESSTDLRRFHDKCVAVPLGINPDKFIENPEMEKAIRSKYGNRPIIFSLGRLIPYKGYPHLVRAAKRLDANVLIAGEGWMRPELERLILEEGVSDKVHLLGRVEQKDVAAFYRACDVFVLPSITRNEAFGIVQMEAMYFGKPVVCTSIPGSGTAWVNQTGVTGIVVPPGDESALAGALNELCTNQSMRDDFGRSARRRFDEQFHISRTGAALTGLFKRAAGKV
ncbi:MAG: glycosyltransferase [Candidatus Wallbacteria bacterium]|nr:glycosyltransferase [Candidatus Wallbacteria bacterium]